MSPRSTRTPVGLFGLVMNTTRVRRRDRVEHLVHLEHEVGTRGHLDEDGADRPREDPVHVERGQRNDHLGTRAAPGLDGRPHRRDRRGEDALVEAVGQQQPVVVHAEVGRRLPHDLVVLRVEGDVLAVQVLDGLEHPRRTAGGVLVEVQPQAARRRHRPFVAAHRLVLISIDAAWASSPSARASAVTVGATRRRPRSDSRCTETTRT